MDKPTAPPPQPCNDIRASHLSNIVLAGLLLVVGILQFVLYMKQTASMNRQGDIMQRQLSEAQAEQRAWLSIPDAALSSLVADPSGLRLRLVFQLKNAGKDPAIDAFVNVEASVSDAPQKVWQRNVCARASDDYGVGVNVFPGDRATVEKTTRIDAATIAAATKSMPSGARNVRPFAVACVVYRDAVTGAWHHTPYAFVLQMKGARPPRDCCAVFLDELPAGDDRVVLKLRPNEVSPD